MYYKAILYNDNTFEVKSITDEEAYAKTARIYTFINGNKSGTFAIRKSEEDAINALKQSFIEKIDMHKTEIEKLKKQLGLLCG